MVGTPLIATFAALWGFWVLLAIGWVRGDVRAGVGAVFVLLWLAGYFGSRYVLHGFLFAPYVAVLDVALVFVVFKGDVRLT